MNAPGGSEIDRRHPSWCDVTRCEAENTDLVGDHRSRVMGVRRREPYDLACKLWLGIPVHGPVTEEPWIHLQVEERGYNGELTLLQTLTLRLAECEDLAEALSTMVDLGRSGEPVDEDEWRSHGNGAS
jgi:hypothetical protein